MNKELCIKVGYFPCWMLCTFTSVLSEVSAQCPVRLFNVVPLCYAFQICCLDIFCPYYYLYHFCFYIPHTPYSVGRSSCFKIISSSFWITVPSLEIGMFIKRHVPFPLSQIVLSGLMLGMFLSALTYWFHNMVCCCHDLFHLTLVHARTSVPCLILAVIPGIYYYYYYYYYYYIPAFNFCDRIVEPLKMCWSLLSPMQARMNSARTCQVSVVGSRI